MILQHLSEPIFPFKIKTMDCFDHWYAFNLGYHKRLRTRSEILRVINHIKRMKMR